MRFEITKTGVYDRDGFLLSLSKIKTEFTVRHPVRHQIEKFSENY